MRLEGRTVAVSKNDVLRALLKTGSDLDDPRNGEVVRRENATSPTNVRNRRFIAEHGAAYQPVDRSYSVGAASGSCFATAIETASRDGSWVYVEGFALVNRGFLGTEPFGYAIHHAWTLDPNGAVFDPVYREHGAAYIGVAFDHAYVEQRHRYFHEIGRATALLEDGAFDPGSPAWRHQSMPVRHGTPSQEAARTTWVAENAYFRWLAEGCPHGRDLEHWLAAQVEYAALHG